MGPGLVVLTQPGKWTLGILVNNVWSFAGQSGRKDVNQMLFQYFINYNLQKGWYITWQPTLTAIGNNPTEVDGSCPSVAGSGESCALDFSP
jgi:hypothetical protein